jgi:DNA-binding NtrC family response regulator
VVITDLRMPRADGMSVVRAVRVEQPDVEVIVLTAFGDVATAVEAMKLGAFDYVEKPVSSPAAIRALVAGALARRAQLGARAPASTLGARGSAEGAGALTFGAPAMRAVVDALGRVARAPATVLLEGESGVGKEIAARTVHAMSPRAARPFVAINCAVLSEALLESELFGHEKGAFTGAHTQRRGRIELADGGTFFLDEVGELRPALQAKLLRVLEERRFERVGGTTAIDVDVRWIAATNRDLRGMVTSGAFREDLYHRLAVFPVRLPPLRERPEDIVPLAERLVARLAADARRAPPSMDASVKERLRGAPWPGNVRELRNVLERALILSDGPALRLEHIVIETEGDEGGAADGSLEQLERQAIERALAAVGGNRREAAARLGIGLRTLYDKLKKYGAR